MKTIPIAPVGVSADVAAVPGGWLVVYREPNDIVLVHLDAAGVELSRRTIPGGGADNSFPRLTWWDGSVFVGYRAFRAGIDMAVLRTVSEDRLGDEWGMGHGHGNSPVCFGEGLFAWQMLSGVHGVNLNTGAQHPLRNEVRPTGLSRIIAGGDVVFMDEDRLAVPDMLYPVWAGDCVVGESPNGGIAVQLPGRAGVLLDGAITYTPRVARSGDELAAVTWGHPGGVRLVLFTPTDIPETSAIPAIGRPCWLGWFTFGTEPYDSLPGNAELRVIGPPLMLRDLRGRAVARYVAGDPEGDIDAIDAAVAAAHAERPGVPVVAYWPAGIQAGRVPQAEWVGVEAYRKTWETLDAFEARVRLAVSRCRAAVLIAQVYTSNADQTTDLASLVPIYARLVRDLPNIVGILAFSGAGRQTGLQDHPEVRPLWAQLAAGIPSAPPITVITYPPPAPPPEPPKPPVPEPPKPPVKESGMTDQEREDMIQALGNIAASTYGLPHDEGVQGVRQASDAFRQLHDEGTAMELMFASLMRAKGFSPAEVEHFTKLAVRLRRR